MQELEADVESAPIEPATDSTDDVRGAGVAVVAALALAPAAVVAVARPAPALRRLRPHLRSPRPATEAEAARFLLQAQFSAHAADITTLSTNGYAAWLNAPIPPRSGRPASRGSTRAATTPSPPSSATSGRSSAIS